MTAISSWVKDQLNPPDMHIHEYVKTKNKQIMLMARHTDYPKDGQLLMTATAISLWVQTQKDSTQYAHTRVCEDQQTKVVGWTNRLSVRW